MIEKYDGGDMVIVQIGPSDLKHHPNTKWGVLLNARSRSNGWLFFRHPDGQWVIERRCEPWELMQVEDQRDMDIVIDLSGNLLGTFEDDVPF